MQHARGRLSPMLTNKHTSGDNKLCTSAKQPQQCSCCFWWLACIMPLDSSHCYCSCGACNRRGTCCINHQRWLADKQTLDDS
jgi:hypothetical protein